MPLSNEQDWRNYKECLRESAVKCAEVIGTLVPSRMVDEVVLRQEEPIGGGEFAVTQEFEENVRLVETEEPVTTSMVVAQEYASATAGDVVVWTVVNNRGNGPLEIGGSIDEETNQGDVQYVSSSSDSEEENNKDDEVEEGNQFVGDEGNQMNFEFVGGAGDSHGINWNSHFTCDELRSMKTMHVTLPSVANHADITQIDEAICESGFSSRELDPSWQETVIEKGQVFDSLMQNGETTSRVWKIIHSAGARSVHRKVPRSSDC